MIKAIRKGEFGAEEARNAGTITAEEQEVAPGTITAQEQEQEVASRGGTYKSQFSDGKKSKRKKSKRKKSKRKKSKRKNKSKRKKSKRNS